MEYEDRGSLTFCKNLGDEPFSRLELNPINPLPLGASVICWKFFSTIFPGGLVFWIINS